VSWCLLRCPNKNHVWFVFTSSCLCLISVISCCLHKVVSNTYCVVFLFSFSSSSVRYFASLTGLSIVGSLFGNLLRLSKTKRDDFYFAIINVSHLEINIHWNKTQTTGGKDEPNMVFIRTSQQTSRHGAHTGLKVSTSYSYIQSSPVKVLVLIDERKHLRKKNTSCCHVRYGHFITITRIVITTL
jgi:hypothetical protein